MDWFQERFANYDTVNLSVSGSKIEDAFQNLETGISSNFELFHDSIIIVLLGTNDFLRHNRFNRESFYSIVQVANIVCSKLLLLLVPPIPLMPELNDQIHSENEWIKRSFSWMKKVTIVNPFKFGDSDVKDLQIFESHYLNGKTDLIHLNAIGLAILTGAILLQLETKKAEESLQQLGLGLHESRPAYDKTTQILEDKPSQESKSNIEKNEECSQISFVDFEFDAHSLLKLLPVKKTGLLKDSALKFGLEPSY